MTKMAETCGSTKAAICRRPWDIQPLHSISDKIMVGIASAATHAYRDNGVPLLRNQNIGAGWLDDSDVLFVDPNYEKTFRNKRLRSGDLLTARTGYPGLTCVVPAAYENAQSFTTLITRPLPHLVESDYLVAYINSAQGQQFFNQSQIGGAQKNVNVATLRNMPIPLPPLHEQRAIANTLIDVDALLAGLDRLIAKKRDLKQAAMQQLLSGRTRLLGFDSEWETTLLSALVKLYQPQTISAEKFSESGFPVYGANGIVGFYQLANHSTWQVTVTCRGSTCGTVNRTVDLCWITGNAMVMNCDHNGRLNKEFFYFLMLGQDLTSCITGTGQPQIVRGPLAEFQAAI